MTTPEPIEPPEWYQIPREETGINIRPSGTQDDTGQPPFGDLFTEQIGKVLGEIRQFFIDWPAHIKAGLDTVIDWLQTVANLDLEWLRSIIHKVVDTTAAVFDVSSWVAFLDTVITSAANLVADSFATVFDWVASLLHGAVRFAENACGLNLTWLHSVIDDLLGWSTAHVALSSQADFIDGINDGGFWNNIVDWMLGGSGSWLDDAIRAITNPINAFFDDVRRFINQMIEPWRVGYFDANWAWKPSLTTPTAALPGGGDPVLTPGSNDGDGGALAPGVNAEIPAAPKNVSAFPFWDILVSGFPAGGITYAIAAVKSGVEGPATQVTTFVGTLFPPNSSTHVDLRWDAVPGASSYRVYRKVDGTYSATAWRLVGSPSSAGTLLAPVVDSTPRSGGSVAAPKSDAELAAQIVTDVQTTADTAKTNNQNLVDTIVQVGTDASTTGHTTTDVGNILSQWPSEKVSGPEQTGMTAQLVMAQTLDQIVSGLTATEASDTTPTDAGAAAGELSQKVNLAGTLATMGLMSAYAPRPWLTGGNTTAEASVSIDGLSAIARLGPGWALAAMICPVIGGPKDYIQFGAIQRTTTLNDVRVALYRLYTDGQYHREWVSGNVASSWPSNGTAVDNNVPTLVRVDLPSTIQTTPGEVYYVEVINKSSLAGNISFPTKTFHFYDESWDLLPAFGRNNAASVTSPATLDLEDSAYLLAGAIYHAALGYSAGKPAVYNPEPTVYNGGTGVVWTSPTWWRPGKDTIDVIVIGGGGSGGVGTIAAGHAGGASTVAIQGGATVVTGAGGAAGAIGNTSQANSTGRSPGSRLYNGGIFNGGGPASVLNGDGTPGKHPGGGSSGAYAGGLYGHGGAAGAWGNATVSPASNYTDGNGIERVRLTLNVGAGGAARNSGLGWQSYAGGAGKVWIIARQNRSI